ncbi:hypothetical protein EG329_000099 [Mollisiaceae sp. DMI_Dod_QoI]|nr:hypothetical protein EG329_000099 [Helotiales sp. DMI_Dod_QoI]
MPSAAEKQKIAINIWTARFIPVVLAGVVGYATYVLVVPLCAHYLLSQHNDIAAATAILTIYFLLFLLMAASLLRLVYITMFDPPYLPLGPGALPIIDTNNAIEKDKIKSETDGIGGTQYNSGYHQGSDGVLGTKDDLDSPGLELFYTKEVFVCEMDGRPKWCSYCANWKPDRTHHCSDSGRCILKMDHFCPWVGGPVGESNFKFFIQYTAYTALYCLHLLVVMAFYIARQVQTEGETYNPHFAAILGIGAFFFLFTAGMTGTSTDLAMKNLTQVERLGSKTRVHTLAIMRPSQDQLFHINPFLASQHPYREIQYPLAINEPPVSADISNAASDSSNAPSTIPEQVSESARVSRSPGISSTLPEQVAASEAQISSSYSASETPSNPMQSSSINSASVSTIDQNGRNAEESHPSSGPAESHIAKAVLPMGSKQGRLSDRDANATRTFAVLTMKQGDNPWDLGTRLLNWETVMGTSVVDWLLPIKRSPCCNHEDAESQFQVGPRVDTLKSSVGFLRPEDIRAFGGRRKSERRGAEDINNATGGKKHRMRRRRDDDLSTYGREFPLRLDDLERQVPQHPSA